MTSVLEDMLQARPIDRSQKYWPRRFENVNNARAPYFSLWLEGLNAQKSSWLSLLALVELTSLCQLAFDLLRSVVKSENHLKWTEKNEINYWRCLYTCMLSDAMYPQPRHALIHPNQHTLQLVWRHLHRMIMSVFKEVIRHCLQLSFLQRPWGDAYCGSPCAVFFETLVIVFCHTAFGTLAYFDFKGRWKWSIHNKGLAVHWTYHKHWVQDLRLAFSGWLLWRLAIIWTVASTSKDCSRSRTVEYIMYTEK